MTRYSLEAMLERQAARTALKLNKPIGGPRWVSSMTKRELHPLACQCRECFVPVTAADRARWTSMGLDVHTAEPPKVTVLPPSGGPAAKPPRWRKRGGSGN